MPREGVPAVATSSRGSVSSFAARMEVSPLMGSKKATSRVPEEVASEISRWLGLVRLLGIGGLGLEAGYGTIDVVDRAEDRRQLRYHEDTLDLLCDSREA